MGDLFGGGGSTTKVQIPTWIQEPMQRGIARAEQMAQMGYQPYYGPEVAAFSPMQTAAMQSAADAATAFGMAPQMNVMASIPTPTEYVGGVRGYGSGDIFEQSVNEFQKRQPEQNQIYSNLFTGPRVNAIDYGQDTDQRPVMTDPYNQNLYLTGPEVNYANQVQAQRPTPGLLSELPRAPMQEFQPQMPVTDGGGFGMQGTFNNQGDLIYSNQMFSDPGNRFTYGDQTVYQPQQQTYGQTYYNPEVYYGQQAQVFGQGQQGNLGFTPGTNANLNPQTISTPDQSQAAAIDFWNQTQAALDTGDLSTAMKFYDQYQAITGTKEPMYGLSALDSTKYNQVRFGNG